MFVGASQPNNCTSPHQHTTQLNSIKMHLNRMISNQQFNFFSICFFYIIEYLILTDVVESAAHPNANKIVRATLNGNSFKIDQRKHFLLPDFDFFFLSIFDSFDQVFVFVCEGRRIFNFKT